MATVSTSDGNTPVRNLSQDNKNKEQPPEPSFTIEQRCVLCGLGTSTSVRLVRCKNCSSHYHAHCANLSLPPEDGNLFCRHSCYVTHAKKQPTIGPVFKNGDYPLLATQIQSVLQEKSDRLQVRRQYLMQEVTGSSGRGRGRGRIRGRTRGRGRGRGRGRAIGMKRTMQEDSADESSLPYLRLSSSHEGRGDSISVSSEANSYHSRAATYSADDNSTTAHGSMSANTSRLEPEERILQSSAQVASPTFRRSLQGFNTNQDSHFRTAPQLNLPPSSTLQLTRQTRVEYSGLPVSDHYSADKSRSRHEFLSPQYSVAGSRQAQENPRLHQFYDSRSMGHVPPTQSSQNEQPPLQHNFESSYRSVSASSVSSAASYNPASNPRNGLAQNSKSATANGYDSQGQFTTHPSSQLSLRRHTPNIPWRNPSAFPAEIYERFNCHSDDANHVFRIDLSPVFTEKAIKLYQGEIDFFFRCFESPDVSLVVKGMGSELNQYIWAWPFILESCGNDTHFAFDHFQLKRNTETDMTELDFVGKLQLSMASFNSYLDKYLSSVPGKDIVVLEDHVTKKTITIVASEHIIALNSLVLAKYCAQLYNDLIKGFQWDVFAGGIHCLLQYLPQSSWHDKFSSPRLHFNFPGARGSLADPGNGTTDTAYQVLVGSLELVIFERFEPQLKADFDHILHRSGYDAARKTMLLDAHLRALRSAGFAFSTVLLQNGEFVHVNKGRQHFWRVVEKESTNTSVNAPCVFLSWEWVYQGVSQRGISTECWFAMKNASMCSEGWVFDPRRAIVEAAKCGVAIVRTGQFLRSALTSGRPRTPQLLSFTASPARIDRGVVAQRQAQMILFLESILPCLDVIVEEAYELGLSNKDDSEEFRKIFDDEGMWRTVDADLHYPPADKTDNYSCGICEREITNLYKQCLGCTIYSRRCQPNMAYPIFRICLRCHSQPEKHHFKSRAIASYYDKILSSEGHTGILPSTRRYQSVRSYFKCRCVPSLRCAHCGGCESCSCLCHTLFQTRFRFTAPANLERLRADVDAVVKYHQQQLLQQQQQQQQR